MARKKPKKPKKDKKDKKKMADYEFKYRMTDNTKATHNGGSQIQHGIQVIYREEGTSDPWEEESSLRKTIFISAQDAINALATGTNPEKRAAYKTLIGASFNSTLQRMTVSSWDDTTLQAFCDANDLAEQAYNDFETFRQSLGVEYPIDFDL